MVSAVIEEEVEEGANAAIDAAKGIVEEAGEAAEAVTAASGDASRKVVKRVVKKKVEADEA